MELPAPIEKFLVQCTDFIFSLLPQRDLSLGAKQVYDDTIQMVRLAEQIGIDVAWIAEHHFGNYSMCPSPLVLASHLAGLTSRIKLFCTTYDPVRDGYYFDYSLFLGILIGGSIVISTS